MQPETDPKHPEIDPDTAQPEKSIIKNLPQNVWAVSLTSFLMDISSEMVLNVLPLFLSNVLGVKTNIIGLIEGVAEATSSVLKVFSGWLSDKIGSRKWLAVLGYALSALSKPFFYFANTWERIAAIRWTDRVGKGIRTAPRDALVADTVQPHHRGLAFGLHRAADSAGAMLGILIAAFVVWRVQSTDAAFQQKTFQTIVLVSIFPAVLAVIALAVGTRDVKVGKAGAAPRITFKGLGKNFLIFMIIVGIFDLGNSSDAFLVLRAQERGMSVLHILLMLAVFNLIYAEISTPAGILSDKIGRKKLIIVGWLIYALIYLGFALAGTAVHIVLLYVAYGFYYGLTYGTAKAMVGDLVPAELRGTAYGSYNAVLGILDFPASLIAGILWSGVGSWTGFGPSAPFYFGAALALIAAILFLFWKPMLPENQGLPGEV
ncbi:MAG: MFS transporter [Anaerolineaceae bacterium]|nr:MFS transporter [Anaerolineaceae bacterium]MDD4042271.1 MFS transporter [Anaerolineaceae bacterium]MDD4578516.1 MFS transporter [Anaerolineaceae bacterium]